MKLYAQLKASLGRHVSFENWLKLRKMKRVIPNGIKKIAYGSQPTELLNYKKSYPNFFHPHELIPFNEFYGIGKLLELYSGYSLPIKAYIEHGIVLGNYISQYELNEPRIAGIITFSKRRNSVLRREIDKPTFAIGPYILYTTGIADESTIQSIKSGLGKTLLVFPVHSVKDFTAIYSIEDFINSIKLYANNHGCKTVLISLFYRDILRGLAKEYEDHGFRVVSAGHHMDPDFLKRLHTFIEIADLTMSNGIGTHIGYSIALNKPHYICDLGYTYHGSKKAFKESGGGIGTESWIRDNEILTNCFGCEDEAITDRQLECCNSFFGLDQIKSPDELHDIFRYLDNVYETSRNQIV